MSPLVAPTEQMLTAEQEDDSKPINVVSLDALDSLSARDDDASTTSDMADGPTERRSSLVVDIMRGEGVESISAQVATPHGFDLKSPTLTTGQPRGSRRSHVGTSAASAPTSEFFINRSLQFFVLHFVLLYALQIAGQATVLVMDLLDLLDLVHLDEVAEQYLLSADVMVTALLVLEIFAQVAVAGGCSRYLCRGGRRCGRVFDVTIATASIALIAFELARPATEHALVAAELTNSSAALFTNGVQHTDQEEEEKGVILTFESVRNVLRTVRVYVFLHRLYDLLRSPLDHLAVLVDDIDDEAHVDLV
jgi:hypothetical protein